MKLLIQNIISSGTWNKLDVQFTNMLVNTVFNHDQSNKSNIKKTTLTLACAYLSSLVRAGHTCLPLFLFSLDELLNNFHPKIAYKIFRKIGKLSIDNWQDLLLSSSAVGNGSYTSPLVLDNQHLYLYRMWQDEGIIARFFYYTYNNHQNFNKKKIIQILHILFPDIIPNNKINWHKIATILGIIHPILLLSGGPGTGKTFTICKIIVALLLYNNDLRIKMITPTGKASMILTHACYKTLNDLHQICHLNLYKPKLQATTVHNLLELQLYKKNNNYKNNNNVDMIDADYLIIDEASMLSLSMLAKLILALPNQIKIIFSGDHNQLYSIEPGSVFKDICRFSNFNYSLKKQNELTELTNYSFSAISNNSNTLHYDNNITDGTCILQKNYRFNKNSGIGKLSNSIKLSDPDSALSILNSKKYIDLFYIQLLNKKNYIDMIKSCAKEYYNYLKIIKCNKKSIIKILKEFDQYRILCALRHGPFGMIKINYYIEQVLHQTGLITLKDSKNYIGRPIIILKNDPLLKLCNGDIGIMLPNTQNNLSAYFLDPTDEIKTVHINQLPIHETCFSMTIHKSQGSSFLRTAVILPNQHITILTKELLYTATTRSYQQLTLYSTNKVLVNSINLITKRYSRLFNRIKNLYDISSS